MNRGNHVCTSITTYDMIHNFCKVEISTAFAQETWMMDKLSELVTYYAHILRTDDNEFGSLSCKFICEVTENPRPEARIEKAIDDMDFTGCSHFFRNLVTDDNDYLRMAHLLVRFPGYPGIASSFNAEVGSERYFNFQNSLYTYFRL